MDSQASPPLLRPLPRRPTSHKNVFHLSPTQSLDVASGDDISPVSEGPSSPTCHSASTNQHSSHDGATSPGRPNPPFPPQKTRSILNLTASTLFGIYSGDSTDSGLLTPFGTGSHTPARGVANNVARRLEITTEDVQRKTAQAKTRPRAGSRSVGNLQHNKPSTRAQYMASMLLRVVALFAAGVAYGIIVMRLHESRSIAPVELQLGVVVDRSGWWYLGFWGLAGVVLGSLLPSIDHALAADSEETFDEVFPDEKSQAQIAAETANGGQTRITYLGAEWNPLVRSVGAFVGIAFAIRRLPWQSTLQVSLTLALVNPCLWYLIDRSRAGFWLSSVVGVAGAAVLLVTNPGIVPAPAAGNYSNGATGGNFTTTSTPATHGQGLVGGLFSNESVGVATWIASVLFCSCVCFGNIGRRLALGGRNGARTRR